MYAIPAAKTAYAMTSRTSGTPASKEYSVIEQVTTQLARGAKKGAQDYVALVDAVTQNRKLWRLLGADVAEPGNGLPKKLKAQIFYISEFVDHHSRQVLKGDETIDILLELNEAILAGLREQGADL